MVDGKLLARIVDYFMKSEIAKNARVQVQMPNGELRDESRGKGAWSAAINAEVARGKAAGLYVDQKIIKYGTLDSLTPAELEMKMKQILEDHKGLLVEADFEEVKDLQLQDSNNKQPKQDL